MPRMRCAVQFQTRPARSDAVDDACARERRRYAPFIIAAVVRTNFAQPDHASALAQLDKVVDGLRPRFTQEATLLAEAAADLHLTGHYPNEQRRGTDGRCPRSPTKCALLAQERAACSQCIVPVMALIDANPRPGPALTRCGRLPGTACGLPPTLTMEQRRGSALPAITCPSR